MRHRYSDGLTEGILPRAGPAEVIGIASGFARGSWEPLLARPRIRRRAQLATRITEELGCGRGRQKELRGSSAHNLQPPAM